MVDSPLQVHALKTPVFSFQVDVDTLKELFDEMDPAAIAAARHRVCAKRRAARAARGVPVSPPAPLNRLLDPLGDENWDSDDVDPSRVFLRLLSASSLLISTVNRGQDYARSALDGKLKVGVCSAWKSAQLPLYRSHPGTSTPSPSTANSRLRPTPSSWSACSTTQSVSCGRWPRPGAGSSYTR